ncbi:hypothetical protein [Taklimakanibacter deserti]|uniref:hypothetical protein n=1 Tax=Taklimakanibacter deserti TaxID=2267839 RepID=UPI0034D43A06
MFIARLTALAGIALAAAAFAVTPAEALTTKECSAKYQAAKEAGTLGDMKWNDFRKTQCAAAATDDDDADQATTKTKTKAATKADDDDDAKGLTSKQCSAKYQAAKEAGTLGDMKWNDFRKAQCGPGASAEIEKPAKKKAAAKKDDDDDDAKGLTSKQCSAKYQAAKEAGTLGDMKWNDFRKAQCGPGATAEIDTKAKTKKAASTSDDDDAAKGLSMKDCSAKYQAAKTAGTLGDAKWNDFRKAECGPGATADSDSKAKKKTAAKSDDDDDAKGLSMKDCSAKYQAAKEADALGDMKWNDFRKAECGPGSSMEVQSKKSTKAVAKADTSGGGLTMKECSAKYQQAKADGKLGDLKWNSFRKAKCSADAADDETVPAPDEASYTNEPEAPTVTVPRGVKFPRGISSKYSNESEGKARMHTCLDQYYANKENDALGGLKWIQKGGGYYSLCNARLKAGA